MPDFASPFQQLISKRAQASHENSATQPTPNGSAANSSQALSFAPPAASHTTPSVRNTLSYASEALAAKRLVNNAGKRKEAINRKLNAIEAVPTTLPQTARNNAKYMADLINHYYQQLDRPDAWDRDGTSMRQHTLMLKVEEVIMMTRASSMDVILACANTHLMPLGLRIVAVDGEVWIGRRENAYSPFYMSTMIHAAKQFGSTAQSLAKAPFQV